MTHIDAAHVRKATHVINPLILGRWSPRALSGEIIPREELMALFEAARWAPSSYNNQPWRFIVAEKNTPEWEKLFSLMGEFNQSWAKNAAALTVVVSRKNFEHNGKPSETHSFDTGAAWQNLALEASSRGLVAHGMQGFDYDRARKELSIPDECTVEIMIAIGKPGEKENLSADLQKMETPSDRKPLNDLIFKGVFGTRFSE